MDDDPTAASASPDGSGEESRTDVMARLDGQIQASGSAPEREPVDWPILLTTSTVTRPPAEATSWAATVTTTPTEQVDGPTGCRWDPDSGTVQVGPHTLPVVADRLNGHAQHALGALLHGPVAAGTARDRPAPAEDCGCGHGRRPDDPRRPPRRSIRRRVR